MAEERKYTIPSNTNIPQDDLISRAPIYPSRTDILEAGRSISQVTAAGNY